MMNSLDERLMRVPIGTRHTLAQIAEFVGTKPSTALKCRLMLTSGFSAELVLSPISPVPNTLRWEFTRHE